MEVTEDEVTLAEELRGDGIDEAVIGREEEPKSKERFSKSKRDKAA